MKMRLFTENDVKRYKMRNGSLGYRIGNYQVSQHDLDRVKHFLEDNPKSFTSEQVRAELHFPDIKIALATQATAPLRKNQMCQTRKNRWKSTACRQTRTRSMRPARSS